MRDRGPFRYWREPLCIAAALVYVLNRYGWAMLACTPGPFARSYGGDLLMLPVLVPIALAVQRRLGLRAHDLSPTIGELVLHWALWGWCFEWLGPRLPWLAPGAVADPWDLLAYAGGGLLAAIAWRSRWPARVVLIDQQRMRRRGVLPRLAVALSMAIVVLAAYHTAPGRCLSLDGPRRPVDAAAHARLDRNGVAIVGSAGARCDDAARAANVRQP